MTTTRGLARRQDKPHVGVFGFEVRLTWLGRWRALWGRPIVCRVETTCSRYPGTVKSTAVSGVAPLWQRKVKAEEPNKPEAVA